MKKKVKYPGIPLVLDGNSAVIYCEREASDAAGAYPITPSTQMGEYFEKEMANGHLNISGRPLIFIEPEGEHAAAAVTAGLSMTGLRATNFSSGQGVAYMHESLYAAVGKRLTYVLNMGCRAMTKASLNVHAGHDDYHAVDDTGFFQFFAKNVQQVADLNLIAHRLAELALTPGIVAQDGFLTTHLMESLQVPERELIQEYLGLPADRIATPSKAQEMLFGKRRRRVPLLWDVDQPLLAGPVQNQESFMQSVAAQRPYFFQEIPPLAKQAFAEFHELTGRLYAPLEGYKMEDADYVLLGQGSLIPNAEAVADFFRKKKKLKVGVINLTMFRPFPGAKLSQLLKGKKGITVLERVDQPLAEDLPLMREVRSVILKGLENGTSSSSPYPGYPALNRPPALYSGCYGLGSRDLQPEALIGAVENMVRQGPRFFYLSIDFFRDQPLSPKDEIHLTKLREAYPEVKKLALHGSENPNLLPPGSLTLRIHSIGGWGGMATGESLALTLADILGYFVKANPKYGSEKKGQPTTFFLALAPEPIRVNCEFFYVDGLLSPDPNLFEHANPLGGLKKGGLLLLQSEESSPEKVWASIPQRYQKELVNKRIRLFALNGSQIAREEASDPELILRMQGMAFQGGFFQASPLRESLQLGEADLFAKIEARLKAKFASQGPKGVRANLQVVKRGFKETFAVPYALIQAELEPSNKEPPIPDLLQRHPLSQVPLADLHRFWEQTGTLYQQGQTARLLADPFAALSLMPAMSGVFRDLTDIRLAHPQWVPSQCTGCGKCWVACPDSALPPLVTPIIDLLQTALQTLPPSKGLARVIRRLEPKLRTALREKATWPEALEQVFAQAGEAAPPKGVEGATYQRELAQLKEALTPYEAAITRPYFYHREEKNQPGGLLNITVHPGNCKGCMECVEVCQDQALIQIPQTKTSVEVLKKAWSFWQKLPTTPPDYQRITDIEEGIGALEGLLLDKNVYFSMLGGDGACLGCGEKSVLHLFSASLHALMGPRVQAFIEELTRLINALQSKLQAALTPNLDDPSALERFLALHQNQDVNLREITEELGLHAWVDGDSLREQAHLIQGLRELRELYLTGPTGRGRAVMGQINSTGCSSVWGSSYPFNPYPVPWVNHLFQDAPSIALGVFEGHMAKMSENFKLARKAKMALGELEPSDLTYLNWEGFTDQEFALCPPVVTVGGDGAMYDIGLQNLSRLMMTGKPIKVVVLDTQSYSNTGGQACTSGFRGQVSDMAVFGKKKQGKSEIRKEIGLIGMGHRSTFLLQSGLASSSHLIEGVIKGLKSRRPALFNLYCTCQPEQGVADDGSTKQAKLALESRAYPYFVYDPDLGDTPQDCLDLSGNSDLEQDWRSLEIEKEGKTTEITFTFADFAATEGRFRQHFTPLDSQTAELVEVAPYLDLDPEDRAEKTPVIWAKDFQGKWQAWGVSPEIIAACRDRRQFWRTLRFLGGLDRETTQVEELTQEIQNKMVATLTQSLLKLAQGGE